MHVAILSAGHGGLGPYMYAVEIHIVGGPKTNTAKSNYFSLQKFPDFLKFVTNYTVAI